MSGLTIDNPVKFSVLVISSKVVPGDIIEMRGGTYTGDWIVSVGGTAESPLVFRPYNGEQVIINGSVTLQHGHTQWQNITIQQPDPTKPPVYISQPGTQFTDCDISGGSIGVSWFGSGIGKLLRCTIHDTADYGIYTHNNNGGLREITDCVFLNIGGYYALHFYSESANAVKDYTISGCTISKPVLVHSAIEVSGVQFLNNTLNSWLKFGNGQTVSDPRSGVIDGNTFQGAGSGITALSWSELTITDNIFAITQSGIERTNISLYPGANLISTSIDRNAYTSGDFFIDNVIKSFSQWQAAGYDANGTYT